MSTILDPETSASLDSFSFDGRPLKVLRGHPIPLGASQSAEGINFAIISRHATRVTLVLSQPCSDESLAEIPLDPVYNRTGNHWHIRVVGLSEEVCYGYRVEGPSGPLHRYDPSIVLLDPASRSLSCGMPWGANPGATRRSLVNPALASDPDDIPLRIPREDTVFYELHVRGFTVDPSSGVVHPGTFAGLIEKIPYLKSLGVTTVELLPIDEFDENDCPYVNPMTGEKLKNFWGYNTIAFAAPKAAYASQPERSGPWNEFRAMVKSFHDAGIEVILDVVFNHTAESKAGGPTYHFRGLDNSLYYMLDEHGHYLNFSGCGNTVNSNHPVVRYLILSCLRSMVAEGVVDGFRFDLASVLGRDANGDVLVQPPVIEMISEDALMADTKLVAEPWDAGGLYQVGSFPGGPRWSVWNGLFRDDVRRFWRGEPGMTSALATRFCGSDDLYHGRGPLHSLNFITCHDGFTLLDLVSYNEKHNLANGEDNNDGNNDNMSWNCGAEGPTEDPAVNALRRRQVRNLFATLMISQGVPMILGGDEMLRTQGGNNNGWCQDNAISWVDWSLAEKNSDFLRFCRELVALRRRHPALRRRTFFQGLSSDGPPDIVWHGEKPSEPDWSDESRFIAVVLDGRGIDREGETDRDIAIVFNAHWEKHPFQVPEAPSGSVWRRTVDTSLASPHDALGLDEGPVVATGSIYEVESRSLVILVAEA